MLFYRFDVPNQKFYYRTEGSKETCVEFSEMFELICMLANDASLYENLMQHSEKGFHARKKLDAFRVFIRDYPVHSKNKKAWRFMTDSIYEFTSYHNHHFCHTLWLCFVNKYYRRNLEPQYHQMTQALRLCTASAAPVQKEKYPLFCTVLDNQVYHSAEPDRLLCCSFLMEFTEAIRAGGLFINKCSVCGTLFCSRTKDHCCSDPLCRKLLREASDGSLAERITEIRRQFTDKICHDREFLRNQGCPPEAEELFDARVKPLRDTVAKRVKEVRQDDASLREIHALNKSVKALYGKINEIKAEIIARYRL